MKKLRCRLRRRIEIPPIPQCAHWGLPPKGEARAQAVSCLPFRGNCGFALPVADEAKPEFPQRKIPPAGEMSAKRTKGGRTKNASKRMCAAFFGHRKAEVAAAYLASPFGGAAVSLASPLGGGVSGVSRPPLTVGVHSFIPSFLHFFIPSLTAWAPRRSAPGRRLCFPQRGKLPRSG